MNPESKFSRLVVALRRWPRPTFLVVVSALGLIGVACKQGAGERCEIDTDCDPGLFCANERCTSLGGEGTGGTSGGTGGAATGGASGGAGGAAGSGQGGGGGGDATGNGGMGGNAGGSAGGPGGADGAESTTGS